MNQRRGPRGDSPQPRSAAIDELHTDWPWLRPTLTFLLGMLVGTVLMAALRPEPGIPHRANTTTSSSTTCNTVATDAGNLAQLADQALDAANDHDTARLAHLQQAIANSQNLFAADVPGCRP